jgi:hypothetical protein
MLVTFRIFVALVMLVVSTHLAMAEGKVPSEEAAALTFSRSLGSADCNVWHDNIEQAFKNENHCEADADCKAIELGGEYVAFGCFKYVNKAVDEKDAKRSPFELDS